jgi:hypothetical protein
VTAIRVGCQEEPHDDATLEQAQSELSTPAEGLARRYPASHTGIGAWVTPFADAYVGRATEGPPMVLTIAAVLLLLVVCANIANMLLGQAAGRRREVALRAVFGASRARIIRQLLVESAMLSGVAGAAGLLLAAAALRFFTAETADLNLPYWIRFDFDLRVFAFAAVVCFGTALLVGLAPAWQLSRREAHDALKDGGGGAAGGRRARRSVTALLIAEVALTLVLLTGASLLTRSAIALQEADAIIPTPRILTAQLDPERRAHAPGGDGGADLGGGALCGDGVRGR